MWGRNLSVEEMEHDKLESTKVTSMTSLKHVSV